MLRAFSSGKKNTFLLLLIVYILSHLVFRICISDSLEKDESELILQFQEGFKLGYGAQPPLYNWLQFSFFNIFGLNVFSLVFLKNSLLFTIYYFLFKASSIVLENDYYAIFSSISLMLIYNFSWVMHKDLTHSVLLMALCSVSLYLFFKVFTENSKKYYILFGVFLGLGILSKYNYLLFALSLLISGVMIKNIRRRIFNKNALLILLFFLLVVSPHIFWCLGNTNSLFSDLGDFKIGDSQKYAFRFSGILLFLRNTFYFLGPLLFIYAFFFRKGFGKYTNKLSAKGDYKHLLEVFFVSAGLIILAAILFFDVRYIKERWLQPILFLAPLYFFLRLDSKPSSRKVKIVFTSLIGLCAIGTLFSVWARIPMASIRGRYNRLNYPFSNLSQSIKDEGFSQGLILAEDNIIGANLKLAFNDSLVLSPLLNNQIVADNSFNKILVIWEDESGNNFEPNGMGELFSRFNISVREKTPIDKKFLYKYSKSDYYKVKILILERNEV